jgi:phage tail sheath protein FI
MPVPTTYPGVYIEERPSGAHAIAGVSTSVTAFVGAASRGPADSPVRIFSFADYVRTFGPPLDELQPMGHAVQHFFLNGGSEAVVVRALAVDADAAFVTLRETLETGIDVLTLTAVGEGAWANLTGSTGLDVDVDRDGTSNPADLFTVVLRYRTADAATGIASVSALETHLDLSMSPKHPRYAPNVLGGSQLVRATVAEDLPTAQGSSAGSESLADPLTIPAGAGTLRVAIDFNAPVDLVLFPGETDEHSEALADVADAIVAALAAVGLSATASVDAGVLKLESDAVGPDSAVTVTPAPAGDLSGVLRLGRAYGGTEVSGSAATRPATTADPKGFAKGSDGGTVGPVDIVPPDTIGGMYALGSLLFPRFNLLCLPGLTSSDGAIVTTGNEAQLAAAMSYCRDERAFLLVDPPAGGFAAIPPNLGVLQALGEHGAVYYPRVKVIEPLAGGATRTLNLPACGAVAGVMARIDATRGIWKAPAGREAGIVGVNALTADTNDDRSGQLNPKGIDVLREFPGAGIVLWGARTLKGDDTSASEFKYIPVRRLTDYIGSSLYLGTQFAVFEPNDPDLHAQLRLAVGSFMRGLFRQGAFQQSESRAESDSFFVICDATVNPQSEIDLGRVNVVVGFAPLKPAEFVVITIQQISHLEG